MMEEARIAWVANNKLDARCPVCGPPIEFDIEDEFIECSWNARCGATWKVQNVVAEVEEVGERSMCPVEWITDYLIRAEGSEYTTGEN
ncbi:hypothetical protein [Natrinema soli]|uniref:Transcription factor zinc-finger domain-containing protein n=1 Tax=Natrinema soli TaxID=1930624 RepID=A0ABD5SJL1_9EURY|nr:hypothetical protein [Natrinema soli]